MSKAKRTTYLTAIVPELTYLELSDIVSDVMDELKHEVCNMIIDKLEERAATAKMTKGADDIGTIEGDAIDCESAKTIRPAGGPPARTETVSGVTDSSRAVDSDAEARDQQLADLRQNIQAAFKRLGRDSKIRIRNGYELHSIDQVETWNDWGALQSLYDSIVSES